jgi:predicted small lipoprotein YifL
VRPAVAHFAIVVVLLSLAACGKKGPPLAPLRVAPARIEDLAVAKTGEEVRVQFTVPAANADQSKPADLVAVEVYAISGKPEDPAGNSLAGPQFIRYGELVGRVQVAPPETPGETPPDPTRGSVAERARAAAELAARQAMPAQGKPAAVVERLTRDDYTPFVHPDRRTQPPKPPAPTVLVRPLGPPPAEEPFSRTYVAVGVSRHGTQSGLSNRVGVPLADAPGPPTGVSVVHAETSATVLWTAPPGTFKRVQPPAKPDQIEARSLAPGVIPTTYNVYRVARGGSAAASTVPVNAAPIEGTGFTHGPITLGEEACYQVRAVRVYGSARLESPPSETACTTFVDTFPPPPPTNLAAVGSEGGVSLIWDPSTGTDVAGYVILRGEIGAAGPPATLAPLTPQPIRESTYRDDTARRGVRYVYAVVAIDGATPANRSVESNRVEEGAR